MKKSALVLVLAAALCLCAVVAVKALAVGSEGTQFAVAAESTTPIATAEFPLGIPKFLKPAILSSTQAGASGCTAPPGCFDPDTYCACVESGQVAEWACRWYFCES